MLPLERPLLELRLVQEVCILTDDLSQVVKVANEHADFLDGDEFEKRSLRWQYQTQASEIAQMKATIETSNEEMKATLGQNDLQLK